jgi:hypothetical protein
LREGGGAFEFGAGFGEAAEFKEKISANTGQQVVVGERWLGDQGIN